MTGTGGNRTLAFDPKRVLRISADKVHDFAQTLRKWLHFPRSLVVDEPEARYPKCPDFTPLLHVRFSRHLERPPHPTKVATALWALGS